MSQIHKYIFDVLINFRGLSGRSLWMIEIQSNVVVLSNLNKAFFRELNIAFNSTLYKSFGWTKKQKLKKT